MAELRPIAPAFVSPGPSGVAVRDRLQHLIPTDEELLRLVGAHLGALASADLKTRSADGLEHCADTWADRKRELTVQSSARWAGAITKASHDQWALARRGQAEHIRGLQAAIATITRRLSLPVGKKDQQAGRVRVVRGGKRLARARHHLDTAGLTEAEWRQQWEAERWFLAADGESGKRYGNETIRITSDGQVSIRLPAPLAHHANAPHGRYVLSCRVAFAHRGTEWADRIEANRAVAYRIHLAAWCLDTYGNPIGNPRRFSYDLSGTTGHRDAQIRHALTRLLHWARTCGVNAIAIEDLDFEAEKTREKHGRRKRFRRLISGMPTGRLRARLTSMADQSGIAIIAADPAYTSRWGAQHWQQPLTTTKRTTTRHDAAAVAIGRRAQGHPIRRRTAPPPARMRATRTLNTVRSVRLSTCTSGSVHRNGRWE
ncbi:IS200/IS605 family accessory protein TnpB-related protein [Nonomuraea sp. NPDC052116]|uniref:IS200/IS605 family accessory protein TnpB-related protein n=1 Tax=Nonomuraea sp. NPDC052116 TaxID=3155665 RepID=UPI00343B1C2A